MADPITNAMNKVTEKVTEAGGSFLSSLFSAPLQFLKGLVVAPFNAAGGLVKGAFNNTFGNLFGLLVSAGGLTAARFFTPDLIAALPIKFGGRTIGEIWAEHGREEGFVGVIKDSLLGAVAINGTIGAASGALGGAFEKSGESTIPTAEKVGGFGGALLAVAGIGALGYAAMNRGDGQGQSADHDAKTPDHTPAADKSAQATVRH